MSERLPDPVARQSLLDVGLAVGMDQREQIPPELDRLTRFPGVPVVISKRAAHRRR